MMTNCQHNDPMIMFKATAHKEMYSFIVTSAYMNGSECLKPNDRVTKITSKN